MILENLYQIYKSKIYLRVLLLKKDGLKKRFQIN